EQWYFDVFVEYAKADAEDILCRIEIVNRSAEPAPIHVLPHLWYRNTWSWSGSLRPTIEAAPGCAFTRDAVLGERWWFVDAAVDDPIPFLFTENETNHERLFGVTNGCRFVKDGINDAVVHGRSDCVSSQSGSKTAAHVRRLLEPGGSFVVRVR